MDHDPADIPEAAMRASLDTWVMFGRLRRRLQALPGESGLSPAQTSVLVRLGKADALSVSQLAGAERVSHQAMAKTVAGLESSGLIDRRPDPLDGRRQMLTLTDAGRARSLGERHARQQWLARALAEQGTPEEIEAVVTAMRLLSRVADGVDDDAISEAGIAAPGSAGPDRAAVDQGSPASGPLGSAPVDHTSSASEVVSDAASPDLEPADLRPPDLKPPALKPSRPEPRP